MASKRRAIADRLKSLQPNPREPNFTLAGVRMMFENAGGKELHCTVSEYRRTQIFEFPGVSFRPKGEVPHLPIYTSTSVGACVTSNLVGYFENSARTNHYAIDPSLRHVVGETDEKVKAQQKGHMPLFLVIEEFNQLSPVAMTKGECRLLDEVLVRDGEKVPILVGGREGKKVIVAWNTTDGAWPELPNNQQSVNLILACVRAGQQTPDPIRKHIDVDCLVTDDGQCVGMTRPTMSMRGSTAREMDTADLRVRVTDIAGAIAAMENDMNFPHIALLVDSMYSDEHKDDPYKRLQYLRLWESLVEAGRKPLGYQGDIRYDKAVLAGKHTLEELTEHRHDIAHWWTDAIDENHLVDLQRTINELIRRKYF